MVDVGREPRRYWVLRGDAAVLEVLGRPGFLRSMAPPPMGWEPPTHPFIDASSMDPGTEHVLRELLLASSSFEGYLARVVGAGFDVRSGHDFVTMEERAARRIYADGRAVGAIWARPGQFSSLWWQPLGEDEVHEHALVTAYDAQLAESLLGAVAATSTMAELEGVLAELGLTVR